ncbi:MAG TPA: ATP-binding protein, partial [Dehalococcoidia bacterium]|nr:ATP-binding protein [Dehalococcoidia bacterium]
PYFNPATHPAPRRHNQSEDCMSTPQESARLEQIKRSWQQKRQITERLDKIKTKIGVYSGKGGVGKTTVAVNLAVTLAKQGATVGLLDVDIDCPNVAKVMGITEKPDYIEGQIIPVEKHGVKVVSMAFFQENQDEAIIWRGPMIHNAINQFLQATDWAELDYLVIDLPPGTSDSPLTIMQSLPMDGFLVVSTPQDLANLDAKRCINMIRKLNLNVLGVVENYTGDIFGKGGGKDLANETEVPYLGDLALRSSYRDTSQPTILLDSAVEEEFDAMATVLKKSLKEVGSEAP